MIQQPENAQELLERLRAKNGKQTQNFKDVARFLGMKAREKGVPISGQFELTPLCNFSCRMCYVHLNPEQMGVIPVLPVETWKHLVHQAWQAGMMEAALTGGECLAYPGFDELFLYLHSLGCEVSVLTNGFLLDEKRIAFFKEHKPNKIQVTLYGWNDDVYERVTGQRAFSRVSENIRKAIEADLPVMIGITPSTYLGEDVLETIRTAKRLCKAVNVNSAIFSPREETGRSEQQDEADQELYVRIFRLMDELNGDESTPISEDSLPPTGGPQHECEDCGMRCGGGRSAFVIDWKGTMMPCNRMNMIHASALEKGFTAAWQRINREANRWPRTPECEGCAYADICSNCPANMLRFAEPGKLPTALCEKTKYFVRHGVRHLPDCE